MIPEGCTSSIGEIKNNRSYFIHTNYSGPIGCAGYSEKKKQQLLILYIKNVWLCNICIINKIKPYQTPHRSAIFAFAIMYFLLAGTVMVSMSV